MTDDVKTILLRQMDISWALTAYHLNDLTTQECLWRPGVKGLHVLQQSDGAWVAEWPESEGYDIGPASIAWLTWHLGFWLSMAIDHSFGNATLTREAIVWPGSGLGAREWVTRLYHEWRGKIEALPHTDFHSAERTRWPFTDHNFSDVVAWSNVELMKSAAEIGYARFAYAVRNA